MSEVTPPSPQPAAPQNGLGTAALVLGIVQFFCFPLIGGVLAIVFGKMGMAKAETQSAGEPRSIISSIKR